MDQVPMDHGSAQRMSTSLQLHHNHRLFQVEKTKNLTF